MQNELYIKKYMPLQIKLEEKYYDQLYGILGILINHLLNYIDSRQNITLEGVRQITDRFVATHKQAIDIINSTHAIAITQLSYNSIYNNESQMPVQAIKPNYTKNLANQLDIKTDNLINIIQGRFLDLIPVGTIAVSYLLYTDETNKADLIRRCNNSIKLVVQTSTTEAVFNTLIQDAKDMGATEYLPDNQHDERVRETHKKYFNGHDWIPFDSPPPCGHVATEAGCRCIILKVR